MRLLNYTKNYTFYTIVLFLLAIICINPIGEFALNDDFSYNSAVFNWIKSGTYIPHEWYTPSFIAQALWGYLFGSLFGDSYTTLRFSTIVLSITFIYSFQTLLKKYLSNKRLLIATSLLIIGSPLFLLLSLSFMTETPFLCFTSIALFFYEKTINSKQKIAKIMSFTICSIFVLIATLTRQTGILLCFAFFFTSLFYDLKKSFWWVLQSILIMSCLIIYTHGYLPQFNLPNHHFHYGVLLDKLTHLNITNLRLFVYNFNNGMLTLGLWLSPLTLLIPNLKQHFNFKFKPYSILLFLFIGINVFKLIGSNNFLIYSGNIYYELGLGPIVLDDFISYAPTQLSLVSKCVWVIIHFISITSIFILIKEIIQTIQQKKFDQFRWTCLLIFIGTLLPPCFIYLTDRYVLFCAFILVLLIAPSLTASHKRRNHIVMACSLVYLIIGTILVYDYFEYHRVKQALLDRLMQNNPNISTKEIDGGFEFNATHNFDFKYYLENSDKYNWWWVFDNKYKIATKTDVNYTIIDHKEIRRIIPNKQLQQLYLLERK